VGAATGVLRALWFNDFPRISAGNPCNRAHAIGRLNQWRNQWQTRRRKCALMPGKKKKTERPQRAQTENSIRRHD
jgi:hypothetical protein